MEEGIHVRLVEIVDCREIVMRELATLIQNVAAQFLLGHLGVLGTGLGARVESSRQTGRAKCLL
jgi:hypothetical protein